MEARVAALETHVLAVAAQQAALAARVHSLEQQQAERTAAASSANAAALLAAAWSGRPRPWEPAESDRWRSGTDKPYGEY